MLYAAFTMDCEQLDEHSGDGGPPDWGLSERAIVGFAERLKERGFRATYFIVPQAAVHHSRLFLDLQEEGFELGLHLHTLDQGWREHLGGMAADEQRQAIQQASDRWADGLGQKPKSFRSGNFSANDHTFPNLVELGFTHASASVPKRRYHLRRAVWDGSPPHPYWTEASNRLLQGELPLLNVPVACHPSKWRDAEETMPYELRIEGWEPEQHREIIAASIAWQLELQAQIVACVSFTHNTYDYSDSSAESTKKLAAVMDLLEAESEERGMELVKTTIGGIHRIACGQRA